MYKIIIPSYQRNKTFEKKTLKLLSKYGLTDKAILYLSTEEDVKNYKHFNIPIESAPRGYENVCNHITDQLDENTKYVLMGDDVSRFYKFNYDTGKNEEVEDLNVVFNETFREMEENAINLGGFYPTKNPLCIRRQKKLLTTDLKFIHDACCCVINKKVIKLNNELSKSDFQRTIEYYKIDGGVLRKNNYSFYTTFGKGKGGNIDGNDKEEEYTKKFINHYNDYIKRVIRHKSGSCSFVLKKPLIV